MIKTHALNVRLLLLLNIFFYFNGCTLYKKSTDLNVSTEKINSIKNGQTLQSSNKLKWHVIDNPILGQMLAKDNDTLLIINSEKIVLINNENEIITKIPIVFLESYLTTDGGLTVSKYDENNQENNKFFLCKKEDLVNTANRLFVYSLCEHSYQIWKGFMKNNKMFFTSILFTYSKENSINKEVLGPIGLSKADKTVLFPTLLKNKIALLTEKKKKKNLNIYWQSSKKKSSIISVDFINKKGWMLLSNGLLLNTSNAGKTWEEYSSIPAHNVGKIFKLKFINKLEGYLIGENGLILYTNDSGLTWTTQTSKLNTTLNKIVYERNNVVIGDLENNIVLKRAGNWVKINKPSGNVDDLIIKKDKLFLLVNGILYYANL